MDKGFKMGLKKSLVTVLFLGFSLVARMGFAGVAEEVAASTIDEAHFDLVIADAIDDAVAVVAAVHSHEAHEPSLLPCDGHITSDFGFRRWGRRMKMHTGIDIAANIGTPVKAPARGKVVFVGNKGAYGKTVMIDHGGNLQTLFAHNSKLLVKEGDTVEQGQLISLSGNSGRSTGPHVHYEVLKGGNHVDPASYI
jgi:murein DD-endopeptidase MepM/ murein hydrolase activator NlpD